jgi:hypothetical protein
MLLARSFKRQVFVKPLYIQPCYRMVNRSAACPSRSLRISAAGGGALTATLVLGLGYSLYAGAPSPSEEHVPTPLSNLLTSYVVYSMCSVPALVDASPALLAFCTSVPGLRQLTEAFVRATFFRQVVLAASHVGDRSDLKKCRTVCWWRRRARMPTIDTQAPCGEQRRPARVQRGS